MISRWKEKIYLGTERSTAPVRVLALMLLLLTLFVALGDGLFDRCSSRSFLTLLLGTDRTTAHVRLRISLGLALMALVLLMLIGTLIDL